MGSQRGVPAPQREQIRAVSGGHSLLSFVPSTWTHRAMEPLSAEARKKKCSKRATKRKVAAYLSLEPNRL